MHPIKGTPVRCTHSSHPQALWDSDISDGSGTITAMVALVCLSFCVVGMGIAWAEAENLYFFSRLRDTGEMPALPSIVSFKFQQLAALSTSL